VSRGHDFDDRDTDRNQEPEQPIKPDPLRTAYGRLKVAKTGPWFSMVIGLTAFTSRGRR
jgi:hypothetical protein